MSSCWLPATTSAPKGGGGLRTKPPDSQSLNIYVQIKGLRVRQTSLNSMKMSGRTSFWGLMCSSFVVNSVVAPT